FFGHVDRFADCRLSKFRFEGWIFSAQVSSTRETGGGARVGISPGAAPPPIPLRGASSKLWDLEASFSVTTSLPLRADEISRLLHLDFPVRSKKFPFRFHREFRI